MQRVQAAPRVQIPDDLKRVLVAMGAKAKRAAEEHAAQVRAEAERRIAAQAVWREERERERAEIEAHDAKLCTGLRTLFALAEEPSIAKILQFRRKEGFLFYYGCSASGKPLSPQYTPGCSGEITLRYDAIVFRACEYFGHTDDGASYIVPRTVRFETFVDVARQGLASKHLTKGSWFNYEPRQFEIDTLKVSRSWDKPAIEAWNGVDLFVQVLADCSNPERFQKLLERALK